MPSLPIVKYFDVLKDTLHGLVTGVIVLVIGQLCLQGVKETLSL